jgi:[protein-PII] uridylyltransferase
MNKSELPALTPSATGDGGPRDCRDRIRQGRDELGQRFLAGEPVTILVHDLADLIDAVLTASWGTHDLARQEGMALAAVGGYGRHELHPGSDIDIAILLERPATDPERHRIEAFVTFLWDIGLEVGHSVRTLAECHDEAAADITVATNLMEARLLAGDGALFERMRQRTGPETIWPTPDFFAAKVAEQIARHRKFHDTAQNLEPNVKEGPGGLRDIQVIGWVAKRHFGAATLHDLVEHRFLTEDEFKTLDAGQSLLWRIRWGLHLIVGRREDRLLFDHQRAIAEQFGFRDPDGGHRGIEQFMKLYYRTVLELRRLNEMLLELFQEAIIHRDHDAIITPLNNRFRVRNGFIEACHPNVFRHHPYALLEIFLLLQQNPDIQGVRASTIRLIRDHRHLIDDAFRNDLRARSLFMEIIRQPRRLGHELARMHRYGVLEAYLPVFGNVVGLMQFDLFHVYTVDEHTLTVVRNMRRFSFPEADDHLPLCQEIVRQLPKPELLYIVGLFHDIAKGRGGEHSELGERDAAEFCRRHGLGEWDTRLVAWLVRHHLLMSRTVSRQDISDPDVVNHFAGLLGDRIHLDYLYLLTVADIRGTNPTLWTSWKDALLRDLYRGTLRALRRGLENPIQRQERIGEVQGEALAHLCQRRIDPRAVNALWDTLAEDYFLRHTPEDIVWHAEVILGHADGPEPLLLVRPQTRRGGTEIFLYTRDRDGLFAITTQALDQLGLTIQEARIITSSRGYTLDTYTVLEADNNAVVEGERRMTEIIGTVKKALAADAVTIRTGRRPNRKLRHFTIPTAVTFSADAAKARTIMEVVTTDRPGVLWRIANAMRFCGVRLHDARIATFGERVEDIFFLTGADNRPLEDPLKFECLRNSITTALAAD